MENKYTIDNIIFIKNNSKHIPYYIGMIVNGTNGCKYFLDEYCTERALEVFFNLGILPNRLSNIMAKLGTKMNNIVEASDEEVIYERVSNLNAIKLIRLRGRDTAEQIGKKLDLSMYSDLSLD